MQRILHNVCDNVTGASEQWYLYVFIKINCITE